VLRLNRAERELGADGSALVHDVLVQGLTMERPEGPVYQTMGVTIFQDDFANASTGWRCCMASRRSIRFPSKASRAEPQGLHDVVGSLA
jgi:hypothetical protein